MALLLFSKWCVNPVILITEPAVLDDYSPCFFLPHVVERRNHYHHLLEEADKTERQGLHICPMGTGQSKLTSFKSEIPCQVAFFYLLTPFTLITNPNKMPKYCRTWDAPFVGFRSGPSTAYIGLSLWQDKWRVSAVSLLGWAQASLVGP